MFKLREHFSHCFVSILIFPFCYLDRDTRRRREPGDAPILAQVAAVHAQDRDQGGQEEEEIGQGFSHFFTFTVIPSHVLKDAVKCFA